MRLYQSQIEELEGHMSMMNGGVAPHSEYGVLSISIECKKVL